VAVSRQRQREVVAAAAQLSRARDVSVRAPARGVAHGMAAACAANGGREAGGARRSGIWRSWDAALAIGFDARSERCVVGMAPRRTRASQRPGGPDQITAELIFQYLNYLQILNTK
jgi:hypothetical protein